MGLFKRKKKFESPIPHKGKVFVKGKKVKVSLHKSTTNHSSLNNVFVGYKVGSGKFSKKFLFISKADSYADKLLKLNKGLSGKGENRGILSKPLYYGKSHRTFRKNK